MDPTSYDFVTTVPIDFKVSSVTAQPDGSHVYVTGNSTDILAIDTSMDQVDPNRTISVGSIPWDRWGRRSGNSQGAFFQPPDWTLAYVVVQPELDSWFIKVFDTMSRQEVGSIQFGSKEPIFPSFSPDGQILFVPEWTHGDHDFVQAYRAQPPNFDFLGRLEVGSGVGPGVA